MLHILKRIAAFLAIGGVLGDIVTMLVAPSFVTWFHTPVGNSALCNCEENARATASALIDAQLVGTAIGALAITVLAELIVRLIEARRHRGAALSSSSPSSPPATDPPAPPTSAST